MPDLPHMKNHQPKTGTLFVLSAPSGAGKTTLVKALMARDPELRFSVSFTTRKPRPGEVPERDYFFVDEARFEAHQSRTGRCDSRHRAQRAARDRLAGRAADSQECAALLFDLHHAAEHRRT